MSQIKFVQPAFGRIVTLVNDMPAYKVEWRAGGQGEHFRQFEVYCEYCHRTVRVSANNPATFDLTNLEESGHPGPFVFSAVVTKYDRDKANIKLMTNPDAPNHGMTSPNMGFFGIVATGNQSDYFDVVVRLSAMPAQGWRFLSWSVAGWAQTQLVRLSHDPSDYDRAYSYTAYFTQDCQLTIGVSPANSGTTVPAIGVHNQKVGDVVQVSATPNNGWRFLRWSDGGAQTHQITMENDKSVIAYFESLEAIYTITVHVKSSEGATVYQDHLYVIKGQGNYKFGDTAILSVDDRGTYVFDHWEDGSTNRPRTITVTESATYVAVMKGSTSVNIMFRINQNDNSGCSIGWISGNTVVDVTNTDKKMSGIGFKIRAYLPLNNTNPKYRFLCWEDGSTDIERTVYYPAEGMRIVAYFGNDLLMYDGDSRKVLNGNDDTLVYSGD